MIVRGASIVFLIGGELRALGSSASVASIVLSFGATPFVR